DREQILKIAIGANCPSRAMINEVRNADERSSILGDEPMHRFGGVVETLPGDVRHLSRQGGLVEGEGALPKGVPGSSLIGEERTDHERHGAPHLAKKALPAIALVSLGYFPAAPWLASSRTPTMYCTSSSRFVLAVAFSVTLRPRCMTIMRSVTANA